MPFVSDAEFWHKHRLWHRSAAAREIKRRLRFKQNNRCAQLWVTDTKQQLWTMWQSEPGGNFFGWLDWNGSFAQVGASQQGGARGAQFWGATGRGHLMTKFQETPGGNWSGWIGPNWNGAVPMVQLAAAQQNNGCVQLWGIDMNLALKSTAQTSPGGNWTHWGP